MLSIVFYLIEILTIVFFIAFCAFYIFCRHKYSYWKKRGVYTVQPTFPFGNIKDAFLGRETFNESNLTMYKEIKASGNKHGGVYFGWRPIYFPLDPEIFKLILTKDFHYFVDRGMYVDEDVDPIEAHLFNLEGHRWKLLRQKLTPTFTSGKMKMMFNTLLACGDEMIQVLDKTVASAEPVDIKDMLARFTTDVIGSCAFGIECNSLKNPNIEFRTIGKKIFEPDTKELLKMIFAMMNPDLFRKLRIPLSSAKVVDFYSNVVRQTIEHRQRNNIKRKDFMDLLIQLKNHGNLVDDEEEKVKQQLDAPETDKCLGNLTMDQVIAQAFLFFVAGFETSSTTLQFIMYQIAVDEKMQDKLRKEVLTSLREHNGKLTYENLHEMKYMDMFISESLRMYPPVTGLNRVCTMDYSIPGTDLTIEKGTLITIPVWAVQMDPEYFPEPEKFDPERFSEKEKSKRHPYTWLPFGEGPRNCIGMRFGLMQIKVAVAMLVNNYKLSLNPKTKTPFKMDPKCLFFTPVGGIWINFEKI